MDTYISTLNSVGDSILEWADPDTKFRGYTEVRGGFALSCTV